LKKSPILILGGRSDIGLAIAHLFASRGHSVQLAARDVQTLESTQRDIELRYSVSVSLHEFDVLDTASHKGFLNSLAELPEIAVCAVGLLGRQADQQTDVSQFVLALRSNFEGPALILQVLADRFEARGSGTLVGISSVAGERGRASNYVYGSAKAGFTAFLSGLRNRLARRNVHVVTVLPGFVDTKMVAGMALPAKLTATPQQVAAAVELAVRRRKNQIYVKSVWRLIMFVIRSIPESLFKKLSL